MRQSYIQYGRLHEDGVVLPFDRDYPNEIPPVGTEVLSGGGRATIVKRTVTTEWGEWEDKP